MSNLKQKPWWLFFTPKDFWVTIYPNIYYPKGIDPEKFPDVIVHENVHIEQQRKMGRIWFIKYIFSAKFRLDAEAEAYAAQVMTYNNSLDPDMLVWLSQASIEWAAKNLSSYRYLWAAKSEKQAYDAIVNKIRIAHGIFS